MELQCNSLLYSGSIVDVYALQGFLQEAEIVSTVFDPFSSGASAGFASATIGIMELYVNELDFPRAQVLLDEFNKGLIS